ncbi:kinase-like domain-containing protein [Xylariales sp. AK1849]|nr:kinase-like domain-containing protein [Xylariales sp. AK1849]
MPTPTTPKSSSSPYFMGLSPVPPQSTPADKLSEWTDEIPKRETNSITPIIRILAPTPERDIVAPLALRPSPTQPTSQPWTDELVKKTTNTESAFDASSSSESEDSVASWPLLHITHAHRPNYPRRHRSGQDRAAYAALHLMTLAIPQVLASWSDDSSSFLLISRMSGTTLEEAWVGLDLEARKRIASEVAEHVHELHAVSSTSISGVDGGPLLNASAFFGSGSNEAVGPFTSNKEIWAVIARKLDDNEAHPEDIQFLKERMPKMAPYVFSHGDLAASNILVKDGNFAGFADFETSGFYPVWWDWVHTHDVGSQIDGEWKMELRRHLNATYSGLNFEHALDWYDYWMLLRSVSRSDNARQSRQDLAGWDNGRQGAE